MKKKRIANILMVAVILAIVISGMLTVGMIKGWFDRDGESLLLTDTVGIITLERNSVSYTVSEDTLLRYGDRISCDVGASAKIKLAEGYLTLGQSCEVQIDDPTSDKAALTVDKGEVFVNTACPVTLSFDGNSIDTEDGLACLSVRKGASSLSIYNGNVDGADRGQRIDWINGERSVAELDINGLNDFNIAQLKAADNSEAVFTLEMIEELQLKRQSEIYNSDKTSDPDAVGSCSITVRCDTILDNMDELDAEKTPYVPADGCILPMMTVDFYEGETVFDLLNRVCKEYGIQIEYSWTPMYDSYYIEGINNLYEFDCGYESGWMYKVNGWFPNYGCSSYTLTGGETIVWCFTCKGLGEDVGASGW